LCTAFRGSRWRWQSGRSKSWPPSEAQQAAACRAHQRRKVDFYGIWRMGHRRPSVALLDQAPALPCQRRPGRSLKPLGPRSARAVLWTCSVQVRRSALGNYYLGNYYLLANGLVFVAFFRRFTCARDPRLSSAWPVLELGGTAQGVVD